jgi:hypothetical protein
VVEIFRVSLAKVEMDLGARQVARRLLDYRAKNFGVGSFMDASSGSSDAFPDAAYVAFGVAIGGKADMPFCSAHVCF